MGRFDLTKDMRWDDLERSFGTKSVFSGLSHDGRMYLQKIGAAINGVAPNPGVAVYIQARRLTIRIDGLEPFLFSAVDACTHLQVAQLYLTPTVQAAVSFVEFLEKSFPFHISKIKTPAQRPFHLTSSSTFRDFTSIMSQRGYIHSVIANCSEDAMFLLTSRVLLDNLGRTPVAGWSGFDLQQTLKDFLYFHNNVRAVPWLGGITPTEKLKSFSQFKKISTFDLFVQAARQQRTTSEK